MDSKQLFKITLLVDLLEKELASVNIFNEIKDQDMMVELHTIGKYCKRFSKKINKTVGEESAINFGDFYDYLDSLIDEEIKEVFK